MKSFPRSPIALAMLAVGAVPWGQAAALQTEGPEEIVVTGFRASLNDALQSKRQAAGSVDAIFAEDVAQFPDNNLAESLQRLPGVTISRAGGEGRSISVRGLGPDYTRVRINGMEALSTGGSTDALGGANRGRGFDFNAFASELFNSLAVKKTADAQTEEGSLGATVELHAAKPMNFTDSVTTAAAEIGYNDRAEQYSPKASFLVSRQFAEGTLGALISGSFSKRQLRDEGASTVRWEAANPFGFYQETALSATSDINKAFHPRIPRYDSYQHEMERSGLSIALQFKPQDTTLISLDYLRAQLDANRDEVFLQGVLNEAATNRVMRVEEYQIDQHNSLVYGKFSNALVRSEHRYDELTSTFDQLTLSAEHEFSDVVKLSAQLGHAQSDFDNPIQTTLTMDKTNAQYSYDFRHNNRLPNINYGATAIDSLDGWTTKSLRLRPLGAENTLDSASVATEFAFNDALTLKGGINIRQFEFLSFEARRKSEDTGGVIATADVLTLYHAGNLGAHPSSWAIADLTALANKYDIYNAEKFPVSADNQRAQNFGVKEDTQGVYLQLDFTTQLGDTGLRGNIGGRYVNSDQAATQWTRLSASEYTQSWVEKSYQDFLPALNLVFEPMKDVLIRASYAEVLARAGLSQLKSDVSVALSGANRTVSAGNPNLEPTRAKTFDVGVEVYISDESMFNLALFRKEISSQVQTYKSSVPFTSLGLPVQLVKDACGASYGEACNENLVWEYSAPLNGPGGDLYGFEIGYQQPFTFLPGWLSNFGFIGNFTYVKAQLTYVNPSNPADVRTANLTGLSEQARNATLYYEGDVFSGRISTATRSDYLTDAFGRNGNDQEGTKGTRSVDFTLGYKINQQLKLNIDASNLTDAPEDQWVDANADRLSYYHQTGRQYAIGAQYRF